jgi:cysteine desulfurase
MRDRPIYLDYQGHTPIDPRVLAVLVDAYALEGNPHSSHGHGALAREAVERARAQIAELIGARPAEIVFTSGATESNNLALTGLATHLTAISRPRVLVSAGEHPSVLAAVNATLRLGCQVEILPLGKDGLVDLGTLAERLDDSVGLVSISAANHEIGALADLPQIAAVCHVAGALLHSDLSQALGSIPISATDLDLASFSAHKLYGPAGIGALYVRRPLRSKLVAQMLGGGAGGGAQGRDAAGRTVRGVRRRL